MIFTVGLCLCGVLCLDRWERKSFFLAMMPLDNQHGGGDVGRAVELMLSEVFGVPKQSFIALVG